MGRLVKDTGGQLDVTSGQMYIEDRVARPHNVSLTYWSHSFGGSVGVCKDTAPHAPCTDW